MAENTTPKTTTVALPAGFDSAEELYLSVHANIGLILADVDYGFYGAKEALDRIAAARKEASAYVTALYEADQL